jgi:poly(A) polymerase
MTRSFPAKQFESHFPPDLLAAGRRVTDRLAQAGHITYFAGGCVRDALLGRTVRDLDIATAARPEQVLALFPAARAVGAHFGVVLVPEGGHPLEVATFRTDLSYRDGRHPEAVRFSSPEEDAQRRDFTINGMFYDPAGRKVLDFVDGRADLRREQVRAIGDPNRRFEEDRLRLLRCLRFAAVLEFEIEPATWEALRRHAPTIIAMATERIQEELVKGLTQPGASRYLQLLLDSGLLAVILPEAAAMAGVAQPETFHPEGDVFTHVRKMLDEARYPLTPTLALGVLLHDVGKPPTYQERDRIRFHGHAEVGADMARRILTRLKFGRDVVDRVEELVRQHLVFMHVQEMRPSRLKRFLRQPHFDEHLELHRLDCQGSHRKLGHYEFCRKALRDLPPEVIRPAPLITGDDLIALGLQPGPRFKEILEEIETLQLEDKLRTRDEALAYVQTKWMEDRPNRTSTIGH